MSAPLRFTVPGKPQGKGRPRFAKGRTYTPAQTVAYEADIANAADKAMQGADLYERPIYLTVQAFFAFPKRISAKQRAERPVHWHTGRPDIDNIVKAVGDALNGVVWRDDAQLALVKGSKFYDDTPRLEITVESLP